MKVKETTATTKCDRCPNLRPGNRLMKHGKNRICRKCFTSLKGGLVFLPRKASK